MANDVTVLISRRTALGSIAVAAVIVLLVVVRAPALVSFPVTVALASGWCAWLEQHPESSKAENE